MLYRWEIDNSLVDEETMMDIAVEEVDSEDLSNAINSKIECYGFEWIWNNLSEVARMAIFEDAVEEYCNSYFVAEEEEDGD